MSQASPTDQEKHDAQIQDVMQHCGCTKERAITLLQLSGNNPEKAKLRHSFTLSYTTLKRAETTTPIIKPENPARENLASCQNRNDRVVVGSNEANEASPARTTSTEGSVSRSTASNLSSSLPSFSSLSLGSSERQFLQDSLAATSNPQQPSICHSAVSEQGKTIQQATVEQPAIATPKINVPRPSLKPKLKGVVRLDWDFILPRLEDRLDLEPGSGAVPEEFDLEGLVGAVQHGADIEAIKHYLGPFEESKIKQHINDIVQGVPAIFYAVATNNGDIIRTWIGKGGDINAVHPVSKVPLLAFAVVNGDIIQADTTDTVKILLSLGADPNVIPAAFYAPHNKDLPISGPPIQELVDIGDANKLWCRVSTRHKLAKTANLSQRYFLEKASKIKQPSKRHRQVAEIRKAEALLGVPYFLVGQKTAADNLITELLSYLIIPNKSPLVMVFAGPSGHGKTELAKQLGKLLSLKMENIDCTIVKSDEDLFGPRAPLKGFEEGSPLNNFLAHNSGKRCIVFLDEFEKTTRGIHESFLLPFDSGEYQNRRTQTPVDCSKTIWILATNALDPTIKTFCTNYQDDIFGKGDEVVMARLMKRLKRLLKEDFLQRFGAPLTGRISTFLPFLPFSAGEQAVIAHKYLAEFANEIRTPADLTPGHNERLIGNINLELRNDASLCHTLAAEEYNQDLGARSLIAAVKNVKDMLLKSWLSVDREIVESGKMDHFVVDVDDGEVEVYMAGQHPRAAV